MIPKEFSVIQYNVVAYPYRTYKLTDDGRISGFIDGTEALRQSIKCTLLTERANFPIYSHDYGFEGNALIGGDIPQIYTKIKNNITDALMVDDRINAVTDFNFVRSGRSVNVTFTVKSTVGNINSEVEVRV